MKRLLAIITLIVLIPTVRINAQQLAPAPKRDMLYAVWNLINKYERYCAINDEEYKEEFIKLFENSNTKIFNDILSYSYMNSVSLSEYVSIFLEKIYSGTCEVVLKNIDHGEPEYDGINSWTMNITFQKEISYFEDCNNVFFSSVEYYSDPEKKMSGDYFIDMKVVWNSATDSCKIRSLNGYVDSDKPSLEEGFMIFDMNTVYYKNNQIPNSKTNFSLLHNNAPITYNREEYMILPKEEFHAKRIPFSYPLDDDIGLNLVNYKCNLVGMNYTPRRWRLRPNYGQNIVAGSYELKASSNNVSLTSGGFESGIDFGYVFPSEKNTRWGFFFGVGAASNTINAEMKGMEYVYYTTGGVADVDKDNYYRYYTISNISYRADFLDLVAPLYFDCDIHMGGYISMYLDLGVKLYYNLKQETTDFGAKYKTWGEYPDYGNLILDWERLNKQGIQLNGFVKDGTELEMKDVKMDASFGLNPFSFDVFGGVGLRFRLAKRTTFLKDLFFDAGATYQYSPLPFFYNQSLKNVINNQNLKTTKEANVMMSYTVKDGESVKNISEYIEEFSRSNTIRLRCSLIYRF